MAREDMAAALGLVEDGEVEGGIDEGEDEAAMDAEIGTSLKEMYAAMKKDDWTRATRALKAAVAACGGY